MSIEPEIVGSKRDIDVLLRSLLDSAETSRRYMLGVTGPPGAGKSTFAAHIASRLPNAIVVPMDGFHLPNEVLASRELLHLKGIPQTFDPQAFVDLLRKIRVTVDQPIGCPAFDRTNEKTIPDAIVVEARHRLIIVEGNYLLLDKPVWIQVADMLDEIWYLDADVRDTFDRLVARHISGGREREAAIAKVRSTDLPNAQLIASSRSRADRILAVHLDLSG